MVELHSSKKKMSRFYDMKVKKLMNFAHEVTPQDLM